MKIALFVSLLILGGAAQRAPIFCFDSPSIVGRGEVDSSVEEAMVAQAKEIMGNQLEGVPLEEGASMLPQLINSTFVTLFQQAVDDFQDAPNFANVTVSTVAGAIIEGFLNTTKGEDMMKVLLNNATSYAQSISTIFENFDGNCGSQSASLVFDTMNTMLSDIFYLIPLEQATEIIAKVGYQIPTYFDTQDSWIGILTPLSQIDLAGLLPFLPQDAGELMDTYIRDLIDQFLVFPDGATETLTSFINNLQDVYKIDTAEVVTIVQDVATQIVADLS
eukprot:TRINITY_DN2695_c0_g1_i2.p1 TRINITY_DN2695_c0_g1~~TRINITY_DN2695_c0_g1_i2.p1  ORF type:complete len:276 (-),score=48.06 TRINITY_DN2695_c0_g1_i2:538-1365(-)